MISPQIIYKGEISDFVVERPSRHLHQVIKGNIADNGTNQGSLDGMYWGHSTTSEVPGRKTYESNHKELLGKSSTLRDILQNSQNSS